MGVRRDAAGGAFLAPLVEPPGALDNAAFAGAEMGGRATGYAKGLVEARRWFVSRSGRAVSN